MGVKQAQKWVQPEAVARVEFGIAVQQVLPTATAGPRPLIASTLAGARRAAAEPRA